MASLAEELHILKRQVRELPPEASAKMGEIRRRISLLEKELETQPTAWDHVQLSRHESRPYTLDYVDRIFVSFREIFGDRKYADDHAIIGGMAVLEGHPVMLMGHQKGRTTRERLYRNYGMAKPEGYRKTIRLMELAEKFNRPILTFIDTPGAYPGIGAEERGQAEAIAQNLRTMAQLGVPIVATVLGEGGSGGALAIGLADRILMMENSIYSVISPESCSAILWRDQEHVKEAAGNLKLTARDLVHFQIVDEIVPEPGEGAHKDWDAAAATLKGCLLRNLEELSDRSPQELVAARFEKFRRMGQFEE